MTFHPTELEIEGPLGTVRVTGEATDPVACIGCGLAFRLGYGPGRAPMALHSLPYCKAFEAIETAADAVEFSRRCRAAQGDHRR